MSQLRTRERASRRKDSGYMLLFLMIAVAVVTITMLGVARNYRRGIQRDREVEMIHRGEQYARAVRRFYHKYGTYPTSIEQLESSNNLRFLRKPYKDPMSPDGEWKLAHITDIKLTAGGGLTPAGTTPGAASTPASTTSAFGNANAANQNTGLNQNSDGTSVTGTNLTATTAGANNPTQDAGAAGNSISSAGATGSSDNAANKVLGGGPLLGVVSKMTTEGIHAFGGKTKYNEWFFIYDPAQDKGQLLVGPYNPNMFIGTAGSGPNNSNRTPSSTGQTGSPGSGSGASVPSTNTPSTTTPATPTP